MKKLTLMIVLSLMTTISTQAQLVTMYDLVYQPELSVENASRTETVYKVNDQDIFFSKKSDRRYGIENVKVYYTLTVRNEEIQLEFVRPSIEDINRRRTPNQPLESYTEYRKKVNNRTHIIYIGTKAVYAFYDDYESPETEYKKKLIERGLIK